MIRVIDSKAVKMRVVSVEPLWESNLGYIARVMKNFGLVDLAVVRPRCNPKGPDAIKFSKHAVSVIRSAKRFGSIKAATSGYFPIGTTAIWHKTERARYNVCSAEKAVRLARSNDHRKIAIVLGRDDTGLDKDELGLLPINICIESSQDYPTLNISHALAIILYEFSRSSLGAIPKSTSSVTEMRQISKQLELFLSEQPHVRDKEAIERTFNRLIARANPSSGELKTIAAIFSIKRRKPNNGKNKTAKQQRARKT